MGQHLYSANIYQSALGYSSTKMSKLFKWKCEALPSPSPSSSPLPFSIFLHFDLHFPRIYLDVLAVVAALFLAQNVDMAMAELMKRQQTDKPLDILRTLVRLWAVARGTALNNGPGPSVAAAAAAAA